MRRGRERGDAVPPALAAEITALGQTVAVLWGQLAAARQQLGAAAADVAALNTTVASLRAELAAATSAATARADEVMDAQRLWLWAANMPLTSCPLVSVILPTAFPERADSLRVAVESVLEQSYRHWELLVVDNGAVAVVDPLPAWWPDDPRVRVLREPVQHAGRARNLGLDAAHGELIAYLDDDCRWFPWWLHAAVGALTAEPLRYVHGVRFSGRTDLVPGLVQAEVATPIGLHLDNVVDTNVLVHREGLGVRWDEQLASCLDYDLMVQLAGDGTTERAARSAAVDEPLVAGRIVPVPACTYGVSAPRRQWSPENAWSNEADRTEVRSRAIRRRPLRVLGFNSMYPLVTETYIGDELEALRRAGVDVAVARAAVGPADCPLRVNAPLYESLQAGIAAHDPDLVLAHWAVVGLAARQHTTPLGIPHAVRLHSFCAGAATSSLFADDHCIGAWELPHAERVHPLVRRLPALIMDPGPMGEDEGRSRKVLSVSAGLPKKGFDLLAAAGADLLGDRIGVEVMVGLTIGHESIADDIRGWLAERGLPESVRVNVEYGEVQAALRSAGALVYSLRAGVPTGQPRSVMEGALAGVPLVLPDTDSLRRLVGDVAHFYTAGDVGSMAAAIREAVDRPHPWSLRVALAERIRRVHAAPELWDLWARDLTDALVRWQRQRQSGRLDIARRRWIG